MFSPFRSMRARIVLMNTLILAALFGAIGASLPPLVRSAMLRSIDRDLLQRSGHFPGRMGQPGGPGGFGRGFLPDERGPIRQQGQRQGDPRGGQEGRSGPGEEIGAPDPDAPGPPGGFGAWPDGGLRRGGPGRRDFPPGPPEAPTEAGTVLRPREIPVSPRADDPAPPDPWDRNAFEKATRRIQVYSTVLVDGEPVRVLSTPFPPVGPVERVLQLPYPLTQVERAVSGLTTTLILLAPIALLAAAGGGYLLTGRALQPVARITAAAEKIGAEDLARRIPVAGDDEFARLAATFNGMLERLDVAFADRERLIDELRDMVERQRRFTADASHELKTPLTAIKANTSLLLSGSPSIIEYAEGVRDIDGAAVTMSRLVQDLLLLAQSDAGQLVRTPVEVPLAEPVARAAAQTRKRSAAPISVEIPGEIVVCGDEEALARLFSNLLDNAARHTEPTGSISVRAACEKGWAVLRVEDTGSGIAAEHLPHLGERFYRVDTHRARSYGGTGLGLAICREIAAAHGGSLEVASQEGAGTTVTVRLPTATA